MPLTSEVPQDRTFSATIDAAGAATISVTPGFKPWLISQVSIEYAGAPSGCTCVMRKRGAFITRMIAAGDAAGGDPPVTIYPGEALTLEWAGGTTGDQVSATVIYQLVEYG